MTHLLWKEQRKKLFLFRFCYYFLCLASLVTTHNPQQLLSLHIRSAGFKNHLFAHTCLKSWHHSAKMKCMFLCTFQPVLIVSSLFKWEKTISLFLIKQNWRELSGCNTSKVSSQPHVKGSSWGVMVNSKILNGFFTQPASSLPPQQTSNRQNLP